MKQLKLIATFIVVLIYSSISWATDIHECEDELGERSFQKRCPPGSKLLGETRYSGKAPKSETILPDLVLYSIPACDACDQVRKHLSEKNISLTEKNVEGNGELQHELKTKTGGDLRVPVLVIGDKVIPGFDETKLTNALTDAGFLTKESTQ
jgi:glutaredoxin